MPLDVKSAGRLVPPSSGGPKIMALAVLRFKWSFVIVACRAGPWIFLHSSSERERTGMENPPSDGSIEGRTKALSV